MAAAKRHLFHAFRISRKLALLSGGFLLVLGATGTAALVFAPARLIPGYAQNTIGSCRTIYQSGFRRGQENRVIAVIATEDVEPADRIRTGVRIARHLAETLKPDLVIVQVADYRGPTERAELRGAAIGTEIVHAPYPAKTQATSKPWEIRYVDSVSTEAGYYFGSRVDMWLTEIEAVNQGIELVAGCDGDVVDEKPKTVADGGEDASAKSDQTKSDQTEPAKPSSH